MYAKYGASFEYLKIRPLEESDIEKMRSWRNDSRNTKYLKDIGEITVDMQRQWYNRELVSKTSVTWAIEEISELKRMVGSVAIYDTDGDTAEVGKIMVGDVEASGKHIGYLALIMAMHIGFKKMGIEKFRLEVHEDNMPARVSDLKAGFVKVGEHPFPSGGVEWDMIIDKEVFYQKNTIAGNFNIYSC